VDYGARFAALTQRGSDYFGREQVRFALYLQHDPQTALDMAKRNWTCSAHPGCAGVPRGSRSGSPTRAAAPVLAFLQKTKLQDPVIESVARRIEAELKSQRSPHETSPLYLVRYIARGSHDVSDERRNAGAFGKRRLSDANRTKLCCGRRRCTHHRAWPVDIALRDLDFVLKLDDNGDGKIVWENCVSIRSQFLTLPMARFSFSGWPGMPHRTDSSSRRLPRRRSLLALFFDIVCSGATKRLTLDYRLFFRVDPSHRGILVLRSGDKVATAVLSPANAKIELGL